MSFPPLPPSFDDDPHGKPTVSEWLLERVRTDQVAVRAVAETNRRIGRMLDRCWKAVNEPEATRLGGIPASSDHFEALSDSDVAARQRGVGCLRSAGISGAVEYPGESNFDRFEPRNASTMNPSRR